MIGHLEIECAADANGRSFLKAQRFSAPWHLSKPHRDGDALVVQVVNATAGLFAEDRLSFRATVREGARLLLSQPSATRVHRMVSGEARLEQDLIVECGGALEVWPQLFIPHAGARYRQWTRIEVAAGGELVFFEKMAPGRVAMGEVFDFVELHWQTDVRREGRLWLRERFALSPETGSLVALREKFPTAYLATGVVISEKLIGETALVHDLLRMHTEDVWIGCSALAADALIIKLVARDSLFLHRATAEIRARLHAVLRRVETQVSVPA